ncbi:MAG TPA: hypothetical protein VFW82_07765 [Dyella sp.]|nr:hypothetical protein [Dyella sp.]
MRPAFAVLPILLATPHVGCVLVHVRQDNPRTCDENRRGDVLTTGAPSFATRNAISRLGLDPDGCVSAVAPCILALRRGDPARQRRAPLGAGDGFVSCTSAHLDGAASEKAIVSGHSVQETPQANLVIRRILREHAGLGQGYAATRSAGGR